MAKHTPGPWREFRDNESHDILAHDGSHVARIEPVNGLDPLAEQDANACLIAAAPNMLAALRHAADVMAQPRNLEEAISLAFVTAAIVEATGG